VGQSQVCSETRATRGCVQKPDSPGIAINNADIEDPSGTEGEAAWIARIRVIIAPDPPSQDLDMCWASGFRESGKANLNIVWREE